jgi:hypothetical protein
VEGVYWEQGASRKGMEAPWVEASFAKLHSVLILLFECPPGIVWFARIKDCHNLLNFRDYFILLVCLLACVLRQGLAM